MTKLTTDQRLDRLEQRLLESQMKIELLENFILYTTVSAMEHGALPPAWLLRQIEFIEEYLEGKYQMNDKPFQNEPILPQFDDYKQRMTNAYRQEPASNNPVFVLKSNAIRIQNSLKPFQRHLLSELDDEE